MFLAKRISRKVFLRRPFCFLGMRHILLDDVNTLFAQLIKRVKSHGFIFF